MARAVFKYLFMVMGGLIISHNGMCGPLVRCHDKIPRQLAHEIITTFKNFSIPELEQLDRNHVGFDLSNGGDGCLAVASGKFGGDGRRADYAILLAPKKGQKPKLIAALSRHKAWEIHQLPTFCDAIHRCYVKTKPAGVYDRTPALDSGPTEDDDLEHLASDHQVISSGTLESTEIIYAYIGRKWFHVWMGD